MGGGGPPKKEVRAGFVCLCDGTTVVAHMQFAWPGSFIELLSLPYSLIEHPNSVPA